MQKFFHAFNIKQRLANPFSKNIESILGFAGHIVTITTTVVSIYNQ